jgi:hypothetical protein
MRAIVVDDVTASWIDKVKEERGQVGWDHGEPRMCDDADAILEMYVAYKQIKKVKEAIQ